MEYLLKACAVITIFYLFYKLFLQRDTFFETNRWFLLIGLITAFALPFVVIPIYIEYTPTPIQNFVINDASLVEVTKEPINIWQYAFIGYLIGTSIFLIRFCVQLTSLIVLIANSRKNKQSGYTFVETPNNTPPFSFFRWMVYNPNQFDKNELEHIIAHEKVHIQQYHSLDIIISQLAAIVFWFNPITWFYKKDLRQNLEFIADYKAQNKTSCKKSYQRLLLKTSVPDHHMVITNNFYNSLIKKRIVMLHKSKSKKINLIKHAFVVPLLAIFLMSFNTEEIYVDVKQNKASSPENNSKTDTIIDDYKVIIIKDLTDVDLKRVTEEAEKKGTELTFKKIKRNSNNEIIKISATYKHSKKGSGTYTLNGTDPIKPFSYRQSKKNFGFFTEWETIFITGKPLEADTIYFNSAKKNLSKIKIIGYGDSTSQTKDGTKPLIIIDGKVSKKAIRDLNPDAIKSVTVLKGEQAIKEYRDKGKNDVVVISTKKKKDDKIVIRGIHTADGTKPLIILDGKQISEKEVEPLDKNKIASISVLKGANAKALYGDTAKDGVVIIESEKKIKVGHHINSTNNQDEFIISGKVILDNGIGLEKTNVIIEEKQKGALTNSKGSYKIKVSIGDKITFSRKGLVSQVVTVNNRNDINVKLSSHNGLSIDASNPKKPIYYIYGKKVSKKEYSKKFDSIMKHGKTNTKTINNISTVSGTITNEKGKPIQGATVLNGTSAGVLTNAAGKYVIKAAKGDKLVYSYKNRTSQNIEIEENKTIDVRLMPNKH